MTASGSHSGWDAPSLRWSLTPPPSFAEFESSSDFNFSEGPQHHFHEDRHFVSNMVFFNTIEWPIWRVHLKLYHVVAESQKRLDHIVS